MSTFRAALWLIRDVTLPSLRQHRLRAALTLLGVVIGTQVVVAVNVINRSVLGSFEHTTATIAGGADLQLANGSAGVPEEFVERLASAPGVVSAAALIQGSVSTGGGDLTLFGADFLGDQWVREVQFPRKHVHIPDEFAFVNAPDSIAVSSTFLARNRLHLGSVIELEGPMGRDTLTVRGTLDPVGPTALFGGMVGLVDLPTAQRLFGREGLVDQVDIMLAPGRAADVAANELQGLVAGTGALEIPRARGAVLGGMLGAVQTVLTLASLNAIVVGSFIIYHTLETALATRRREFALARAVGYRQRILWIAIGIEALTFGLVGSIVGIVLGVGAARLSLDVVTSGIGAIWASVDHAGLAVSASDLALALGLGLGATGLAALAPALATVRLRTAEYLGNKEDEPAREPGQLNVTAIGLGLAVAAAGYALFYSGLRPEGFWTKIALIMGSVVVVTIGYTLLAPLLTALAVRPFASLWHRLAGLGTILARESIARDPARYRSTIAALMVAFAMVLIVNAFVRSLRGSMLSWVEQTLASDLLVSPGMQLDLPAGRTLAGELATEVRAVAGVAEVSPSRMLNVRIGPHVAVLRTESAEGFRRQPYPVVEGDPTTLPGQFARGAVVVSDNFAYRHRIGAGDELALDTPSGRHRFPVAAVVIDYTLDIGTVIIVRDLYETLWRDTLVNSLRVWVTPGSDTETVRQAIAQRVRGTRTVAVLTASEFKHTITRALDDALRMTYALQLVAIAIAIIGVVNFFLAEVADRRREIGLLLTVALTRRQVLRVFSAEAFMLGALGGVMATLFAWPVARALITRSTRLVSGWALTFEFSLPLALATILVSALTAMAAAYYPARRTADACVGALVAPE